MTLQGEEGHGLESEITLYLLSDLPYNRLSIIQLFTSTHISLDCISGCQAGMVLNKHFIIKDSLCLITCNKKLLYGVRSNS